jgi:hypothetical protein
MSEPVTTTDMLIGSALLLILFALFAVGFGAIGLAFYALEFTTKRFFPELASHWQIAYYGFLCLMFLLAAVRHIRLRHRLSTFLSLAGSAAMLSVLFANPHLRFGANEPYFLLTLFPILSIPANSEATRARFLIASSGICVLIALNTGLLGTGRTTRVVTDLAVSGAVLWFALNAGEVWGGRKNPGPKAPLSPTRA